MGGLGLLVLVIYFWRFVAELPDVTRRPLLVSAALYVGGALGIECLEGHYASRFGEANFGFCLFVTVEEFLEMWGAILFIHTFLRHLGWQRAVIQVKEAPGNSVRHGTEGAAK